MRGKHSPGFTLRGLARENNLQCNQIRRYIKSLPELRRLVHKKGGNSTKHSGRPTSLANANELCEWVVNLRREGMPISVYLLLDSYKCHLMSSVVHAIQDLGIEVEHIPGGCTGLVQPLDVGVNKPLKNRIRRKWEEYMLEEGLAMTVSKPPPRQRMATWVTESLDDLSEHIVKAAWRRNGYSYFPQEEVQVQLNIEQDTQLDDEVDISDYNS